MPPVNDSLKRLFLLSFAGIVAALVITGFLAVKSMGKIDTLKETLGDSDDETREFAWELLTKVDLLKSTVLQAPLTPPTEILDASSDLREFVAEKKALCQNREELDLYEQLEEKTVKFQKYIDFLTPSAGSTSDAAPLAEIQERINGLNEAIQTLEDDSLAQEIRSLLQRCHTGLLMIYAGGATNQAEIVQEEFQDLDRVLQEAREKLPDEDLKNSALNTFSAKLARFRETADELSNLWISSPQSEERLQGLQKLDEARDNIVEFSRDLVEYRHSKFQSAILDYQSEIQTTKYSLLTTLGLVFLTLVASIWLAREAFLKPAKEGLAQANAALEDHENLAVVGTIASGMAHEIRNPITTIKARLFALGELANGQTSVIRQVEAIQSETNRMEHLVQDFLRFARPAEAQLVPVEVSDFLLQIHALVLPEMTSRGVTLTIESTEKVLALIDEDQLTQVFLNLIRNAAEACPDMIGEITISAECSDGLIVLSVSDNGSGIPPEYLERVFEPFFSKKKGGTGLGLAISRNIVESHHGTLTCKNRQNGGAIFIITINPA